MISVFRSSCKALQVLFKKWNREFQDCMGNMSIVTVIIQEVIEKYWKTKAILSVKVEKMKKNPFVQGEYLLENTNDDTYVRGIWKNAALVIVPNR